MKYVTPDDFFEKDFTKLNFDWGSSPDPTGGAYDDPTDPIVSCGGRHPSPFSLLMIHDEYK